MPTRILGVPFTVTEFNYVRPNRHRAEGSAVILPAYASLQNWDGLYNFQYAMNESDAIEGGVENYFSLACDPISLLGDRVGALLFLRRDIQPARRSIAYAMTREEAIADLKRLYPDSFSHLGLISEVGTLVGSPKAVLDSDAKPDAIVVESQCGDEAAGAELAFLEQLESDAVIPADSFDPQTRSYVSDTGEIVLNAAAESLQIVARRSELFRLSAAGELSGDQVRVQTNGPATVTVTAMDHENASLGESDRLLVLHLTETLPDGTRFANKERLILEQWGKFPQLVEWGEARLALNLDGAGWQAWAVDMAGERLYSVPMHFDGALWQLSLSTSRSEGTCLAYELKR